MKKFMFPLERVMQLRQAQARAEEAKLERLYGERSALDARERTLHEHRRHSEDDLRGRDHVNAEDLGALDAFQQHVQVELQRNIQARAACDRRIQAQLKVVNLKRRDVKLLEKLRQERELAWSNGVERELAQQAEESHLAKWNRENIK